MPTFRELSTPDKRRFAELMKAPDTPQARAEMARLNIGKDTALKYANEFNHWYAEFEPYIVMPPPIAKSNPLQAAGIQDDSDKIKKRLTALKAAHSFIQVMHLCDVHLPFYDATALEMAYKLLDYVKPQVVVIGSDTMDFSLISRFPKDPDLYLPYNDEIKIMRHYYIPYVRRIRATVPDAMIVFIIGNHEARMFNHVRSNASEFRLTIWEEFDKLIKARKDADVYFAGYTDHLRISDTVIHHGQKGGDNPAQAEVKKRKQQVNSMSGHVHRASHYDVSGYDYDVSGVTSGCLCDIPEHYRDEREPTHNHQLGTAIADVNMRGRGVKFYNQVFVPNGDTGLYTRLDRRTFEVSTDKAQSKGNAA